MLPEVQAYGPGARFGPADDPYEICEEIGSGAAARVYACKLVRTGDRFAVKVMQLSRMRMMADFEQHITKLNREVEILQNLKHPRIVNLINVCRTENWCFIVMELVFGGELFDQIVKNKCFNEIEARYIFRQLLEAIGYMHGRNVIHRDLKPENILIASTKEAPDPPGGKLRDVKVADFGLSKVVNDGQSQAKTFVGTPQYWAPEVLAVERQGGSYTQAADFWSLGAVLFVMLVGRYPFDGKKMPLEAQIQSAAYNMNTAAWSRISDDAKDLVKGLLKVSPSDRLGLEACWRHSWVIGTGSYSPLMPIANTENGCQVTEVLNSSSSSLGGPVGVVTQPSQTSDNSVASVERNDSVEEKPQTASSHVPRISVQPAPEAQQAPAVAAHDSGQETIFCLSELLNLQVSIANSLEMACLAFRHADVELCDAIRDTLFQARELSQHGSNIVSRYAQVAQQVGEMVLPDLTLAVQEKEPSLAVSLLGMVKGWVTQMKADGEEMQARYHRLQESVQALVKRAQQTKRESDRRLGEAVQAVEAEHLGQPPPLSPRTQQVVALMPPTSGLASMAHNTFGGATPSSEPAAAYPTGSQDGYNARTVGGGGFGGVPISLAPGALQEGGGARSSTDCGQQEALVAYNMNSWTQQLFDQLTVLQDKQVGPPDGASTAGSAAAQTTAIEPRNNNAARDRDEAWKRDILELLFMAPGVLPSQLPVDEATGAPPRCDSVHTDEGGRHRDRGRTATDDVAMGAGDVSPTMAPTSDETAMVLRVSQNAAKRERRESAVAAVAEAITHSSASLLRALRELKRVDEILQGCTSFWSNMDGTVQKLAQMKEHTETLVRYAGNSKNLRDRFEQRVDDYSRFWSSLERLCKQYVTDHQAASKRTYEMIREASDFADVVDTQRAAQAARIQVRAMAALADRRSS